LFQVAFNAAFNCNGNLFSPVGVLLTGADQCKSGNVQQLLMVKNSCRSMQIWEYTPVADGKEQLPINANLGIYTSR
jgi:hypothetical protein